MAHRKVTGIQREAPLVELREAWFDGWVEGAGWALGRTLYALRRDAVPLESVTSSVVEHLGYRASDTSYRSPSSRGCGESGMRSPGAVLRP